MKIGQLLCLITLFTFGSALAADDVAIIQGLTSKPIFAWKKNVNGISQSKQVVQSVEANGKTIIGAIVIDSVEQPQCKTCGAEKHLSYILADQETSKELATGTLPENNYPASDWFSVFLNKKMPILMLHTSLGSQFHSWMFFSVLDNGGVTQLGVLKGTDLKVRTDEKTGNPFVIVRENVSADIETSPDVYEFQNNSLVDSDAKHPEVFTAAIDHYKELLGKHSNPLDSSQIKAMLAISYLRLNNLDEAKRFAQEARNETAQGFSRNETKRNQVLKKLDDYFQSKGLKD